MSTPIPKRLRQSAAYHYAPQQEAAAAAAIGGRVTPASGAGVEKGDARARGVARIECKATSQKSFALTRAMIDKIETAAETAGELPFIEIVFLPTKSHPGGKVVVCPAYVMHTLQT